VYVSSYLTSNNGRQPLVRVLDCRGSLIAASGGINLSPGDIMFVFNPSTMGSYFVMEYTFETYLDSLALYAVIDH
jgi:hypothetical protein